MHLHHGTRRFHLMASAPSELQEMNGFRAQAQDMENLSEILKGQAFCLFTTKKKSGEGVPTPMWFVLRDESVYMTTRGQSWKVKRLKRNPNVTIGWSDGSGKRHGKLYPALATLVEDEDERAEAKMKLNKKYGLKKKIIDFFLRFAKDKTEAIIKVSLEDSEPEES